MSKVIRAGNSVNPEIDLLRVAGKDLEGCTLETVTEVFSIDEDGNYRGSLGCFRQEDLAKVFAGQQPDGHNWNKTKSFIALVHQNKVYLLGNVLELHSDEEKISEMMKASVLKKLSAEERKILGI